MQIVYDDSRGASRIVFADSDRIEELAEFRVGEIKKFTRNSQTGE